MQRVQRGGGGRRHPGGVGPGLRVADLLRQHVRHPVRRRPHALADLRLAAQAAGQADIDVLVLVGLDPGGALHVVLADHRPGLHRGVDLVAGAVEEAGVDEHHAMLRRGDAGLQVGRGAPLLVHDAHLQRVARQAQQILDAGEQRVGEGDFVRAVHLRLDDVDRAGARIAQRPGVVQVVQRDQRGDRGIQQPLRDLAAVGIQHRVGVHVMADIAHQHQAAARQGQRAAARLRGRCGRCAGGASSCGRPSRTSPPACRSSGRASCDRPAPCPRHRPRRSNPPVLDGGDRGFQHHVGDARRIVAADRAAAVDQISMCRPWCRSSTADRPAPSPR